MSQTELFYQKLGIVYSSVESNPYIHWGHELEPVILHNGQYLDPETQTYIGNEKLRKLTSFPYMINNPELPWLLANVDGLENFSARWWTASGVAEAKNISRQAAEKWETIPPYHFFQTQMYVQVLAPMLKEKRALILYLQDGHDLYGYYLDESPELASEMIDRSYTFHQTVLKGQDIVLNTPSEEKRLQFLSQIEPPPDHTKAWERFFSELYKSKLNYVRISGNDEMYEEALAYTEIGAKMREMDKGKQLHKNRIFKFLKDNDADVISFGERGKITYNKKLYVKLK